MSDKFPPGKTIRKLTFLTICGIMQREKFAFEIGPVRLIKEAYRLKEFTRACELSYALHEKALSFLRAQGA